MAFARLAMFPGGTEAQHRAIFDALGAAAIDPPGRLVFAAGPCDEGWQILQVWSSQDELERWVEAHLGRAFAAVGDRGYPAPPVITDFELTDLALATPVAS